MVKMLHLGKVLPADDIHGTKLVQAMNELGSDCEVWENSEESDSRVRVTALRLVFLLADSESIENATPEKLDELRKRSEQIAAVHIALFPGEHCIVEFRDHTAATLTRSEPIGPSYAEVVASRSKRD